MVSAHFRLSFVDWIMVEVIPQAQFIIGIITIVVFSILIFKTIKNISLTNNDDDAIINLDKVSERKRKNK